MSDLKTVEHNACVGCELFSTCRNTWFLCETEKQASERVSFQNRNREYNAAYMRGEISFMVKRHCEKCQEETDHVHFNGGKYKDKPFYECVRCGTKSK
jgi:hypothetical protein